MITGVLMNWKRAANVARIVAGWKSGGIVSEAIVWNNNPDPKFALPKGLPATVVQAGQDMGLYTRFAVACLAQNECLLIQDDDLELKTESLRRLHEAWLGDPDILHGVFGRAPKWDGSYAKNIRGNGNVPVVLARVLLAHRRYAADFFRVAPVFAEIQRDSCPFGNGEDIILSYTARSSSGRLNRVHDIPVRELPAPHAMHGRNRAAHIAHRTRLLQACEAWLQPSARVDDVVQPAIRYYDEDRPNVTVKTWEELHAS
jgi:hypothetical protein